MIRNDRYKLIVYHAVGGLVESSDGQLFDMREDPRETRNLWQSPDHRGIRSELILQLTDWLVEQEIRNLGSRGGATDPPWLGRRVITGDLIRRSLKE